VYEFCLRNDIHLMTFPANATGFLQPLDVAVWKSFKSHLTLLRLIFSRHTGVDGHNIVYLAMLALEAALEPSHIMHGFAQAGAWPISSAQLEHFVRAIPESNDDSGAQTDWHGLVEALKQIPSPRLPASQGSVSSPDSVSSSSTGTGSSSASANSSAVDSSRTLISELSALIDATRPCGGGSQPQLLTLTAEQWTKVAQLVRSFHLPVAVKAPKPLDTAVSAPSDGSCVAHPELKDNAVRSLLINHPALQLPTLPVREHNKTIAGRRVRVNATAGVIYSSPSMGNALYEAGRGIQLKDEQKRLKAEAKAAKKAAGKRKARAKSGQHSRRKPASVPDSDSKQSTRASLPRKARPLNLTEPDILENDDAEDAEWDNQVEPERDDSDASSKPSPNELSSSSSSNHAASGTGSGTGSANRKRARSPQPRAEAASGTSPKRARTQATGTATSAMDTSEDGPAASDSDSDSDAGSSSENEAEDDLDLTVQKGEFAVVWQDDPEHKHKFFLARALQASTYDPTKHESGHSRAGFRATVYSAAEDFGAYKPTDAEQFIFWTTVLCVPIELTLRDRIKKVHEVCIRETLDLQLANAKKSSKMDTSS